MGPKPKRFNQGGWEPEEPYFARKAKWEGRDRFDIDKLLDEDVAGSQPPLFVSHDKDGAIQEKDIAVGETLKHLESQQKEELLDMPSFFDTVYGGGHMRETIGKRLEKPPIQWANVLKIDKERNKVITEKAILTENRTQETSVGSNIRETTLEDLRDGTSNNSSEIELEDNLDCVRDSSSLNKPTNSSLWECQSEDEISICAHSTKDVVIEESENHGKPKQSFDDAIPVVNDVDRDSSMSEGSQSQDRPFFPTERSSIHSEILDSLVNNLPGEVTSIDTLESSLASLK